MTRIPVTAAAIVAAALLPCGALPAQTSDTVWVNTRSNVYHCRGTEYFGTTTRGEYLLESVARERGHRANGGRACPPMQSGVGAPVASVMASPRGTPAEPQHVTPPELPTEGLTECRLTRVTDGDTVDCAPLGAIRLIGVDTPERAELVFWTAATAGLAALVPLGATLQVEKDRNERDRFGRTLAYLWYDGQMLNWTMLRQGWGRSDPYEDTPRYHALFDRTEDAARAESRGLWRVDGLQCRAKDRSRGRC